MSNKTTLIRPKVEKKDGNPKDNEAICKVPMGIIPPHIVAEVSLALAEGKLKYGGANWREKGVRSSVYLDATGRHLGKFVTGEDIDAFSGLSHITKAISSLIVLRDAMLHGNWTDDRPPKSDNALWASYDAAMAILVEKYGHIQPDNITELTHGGK